MEYQKWVSSFFHPKYNFNFFVRLLLVGLAAYGIFGYLLIPCVIRGGSMEPTYDSLGINFCWTGAFWNREPQIGDVVVVKLEDKIFYLKRVVALPGDTVWFENGVLFRNGAAEEEPYVKLPCNWNLPPRKIEANHYYVVGDNRSMDIDLHQFGQVARKRIIGEPLW